MGIKQVYPHFEHSIYHDAYQKQKANHDSIHKVVVRLIHFLSKNLK